MPQTQKDNRPLVATFQLIPEISYQELDGINYMVAPAVIIIEGVLNGELIPGEEIAAYVDAWNDTPVIIGPDHPRGSDGAYISANRDPHYPKFGRLYGARWQENGRKLLADLYLNEAKIADSQYADILDKIKDGNIVELSSAFFRDRQYGQGIFNNARYDGISRNLRPDHLILLTGGTKGACSVSMGCGVPRGNAAQDYDYSQSVMIALYPSPGAAGEMALSPEQATGADYVLPANELHITLAYLGEMDSLSLTESQLLEALAMFAKYTPVIYAEVQGGGYFAPMGDSGSAPYFGLITSQQIIDIRRDLVDWALYEAPVNGRHMYQPHLTLCYYPPGLDRLDLPMITRRSLAFDAISLSWGGRITHFKLQGEISEGEAPASLSDILANIDQKDGSIMSEQNTQLKEVLAGIAALTDQVKALTGTVTDVQTAVNNQGERLEAVETIAANAANAEAAQKAALVAELAAAQACPLGESALNKLDVGELQGLAARYTQPEGPTDYLARAGSFAAHADNEGWENYGAE